MALLIVGPALALSAPAQCAEGAPFCCGMNAYPTTRYAAELPLDVVHEFATAEGKTLRFDPAGSTFARYEYALSVYYEDPDDLLPDDVVEFQAWVADDQGDVWTTTTRFLAGDVVGLMRRGLRRLNAAPATVTDVFNSAPALGPVRSSLGGHESFEIAVGSEVYEVHPEYGMVQTEVWHVVDGRHSRLVARSKDHSLITWAGQPLPAFWRWVDPNEMWAWNTAAPSWSSAQDPELDVMWIAAFAPYPLIFERAAEKGQPQSSVTIAG